MIVFGWGTRAKPLGEGFCQTCDNCGNTRRFLVVENSKRVTLYFVPVIKWSREYFYVCPICSHGFQIRDRPLAQRIVAGALCDPVTPEPSLIARLREST